MGSSHEWYGRFALPLGAAGRWRLGPLTMLVRRLEQEWRVTCGREVDHLSEEFAVDVPFEGDVDTTGFDVTRYALGRTGEALSIRPALAARSIVSNPEEPFLLPPGETVTAYLTTPVWLVLSDGADRPLGEVAVQHVQDTWFGASTVSGALCYASRTMLRLDPAELTRRPWRAITPVTLMNTGEGPLVVDRVRLPVPNLALYAGPDGRLWTNAVTLDRQSGTMASIHALDAPPREAPGASLVASPREPLDGGGVMHAFGAIFGL